MDRVSHYFQNIKHVALTKGGHGQIQIQEVYALKQLKIQKQLRDKRNTAG